MAAGPMAPRDVVAGMEARPVVPDGSHDRFAGYAVFGVRFESGDILALRRSCGYLGRAGLHVRLAPDSRGLPHPRRRLFAIAEAMLQPERPVVAGSAHP